MSHEKNNGCNRVFEIFEQLSKIPRGSGHMNKISEFCTDFAKNHALNFVLDNAKNVIIYKPASHGFESAKPVILQGHLDMVWQKDKDSDIDFMKDGITPIKDGDFLRANGTTLGADNGIAIAMILSVLEREDIPHPPIEAVFTTDEEIGMLGAISLDPSLLFGKHLINLDSEEDGTVTVSCAGGSNFHASFPCKREKKKSASVQISLYGLKGGHSGVEINSHRVNAATLTGRILNHLSVAVDFDLISLESGNKENAIPNAATITVACADTEKFKLLAQDYIALIKHEISHKEDGFCAEIKVIEPKECLVIDKTATKELIYALTCTPNGIIEMSSEIEGLVETSLNLGILTTQEDSVSLCFALRSNKSSALTSLEAKMNCFFSLLHAQTQTSGHYPPWEYKENSPLTSLYIETYREKFSKEPKVEAIHAGLECAIFSSRIPDVDCIAIGPTVYDAHTTNERLSISSTKTVYEILLTLLEKLAKCK